MALSRALRLFLATNLTTLCLVQNNIAENLSKNIFTAF